MKTLWRRLRREERGFTLIELTIVVALLGITSGMFAVTFGATVTRSSEVSDQNILQTEVRASLNQLVEDLRSASVGDETVPIITPYTNSSVEFYSPDRLAPNKMRKVKYWLDGTVMKRQITMSLDSDGQPPWSWPATPGETQVVVASVQAPEVAPQPLAPYSGWATGQVFKYCGPTSEDDPSDMEPLPASAAPDPITWNCTPPASVDFVETIVVRAAVSASARSSVYTYGAVATLRWNAS